MTGIDWIDGICEQGSSMETKTKNAPDYYPGPCTTRAARIRNPQVGGERGNPRARDRTRERARDADYVHEHARSISQSAERQEKAKAQDRRVPKNRFHRAISDGELKSDLVTPVGLSGVQAQRTAGCTSLEIVSRGAHRLEDLGAERVRGRVGRLSLWELEWFVESKPWLQSLLQACPRRSRGTLKDTGRMQVMPLTQNGSRLRGRRKVELVRVGWWWWWKMGDGVTIGEFV